MIERAGLRIAFTGRRNVGKSTAVNRLKHHGFYQIHAFTGGKIASAAYFNHVMAGTSWEGLGDDMANGDLKDTSCPHLPGNVSPRVFLEDFGRFMGVGMGVEWTLKMELERAERLYGADANIAVDSMVYESDYWKSVGGVIVRLDRPDFEGQPVVKSDADQAAVRHDYYQFADTPEAVEENIDFLLKSLLTKSAYSA